MVWLLARRNLRRSISRTVLLVAGVTIAGALLFDMSMLSGGLEASFAEVLGRLGYEIRVVLRGTLPFETDALLPGATRTASMIAAQPDVAWAAPVLGTSVYAETTSGRIAAFALGIQPEVQGIVAIKEGRSGLHGLIINPEMARALHLGPGDSVRLVRRISPQTGSPQGITEARVQAVGEFVFDLRSQRTLALPLTDLQRLLGLSAGEASFLIVKLRQGADPEAVGRWIAATFPGLDAYSIPSLLRRARAQLTYFNHFAVILGAVSLLVTLLLIGAVLTLAVGERLGELATLRALGLRQGRLVVLLLLEGALLAAASTPLALLLGAAVSRPLDAILRAAPGVPQDLRFFVLTSEAAVRAVVLLLATGTLGAAYPAWVAGRLNIAATLHREAQ